MLEDDINKVNNLLERKKNYQRCIKYLQPLTNTKLIQNHVTGKYEHVQVREFAYLHRDQPGCTLEWGLLDERVEAELLPIFKKLLVEVEQEIAAVSITGVSGKGATVKTMLSEEIQPMFKAPNIKKKNEPTSLTKWLVALLIGVILMVVLYIL